MWKAGEVEDGTAKKLGKPLEPKLRDAGGCVKLACLSLRRPLSGNVPSKCSDESSTAAVRIIPQHNRRRISRQECYHLSMKQ